MVYLNHDPKLQLLVFLLNVFENTDSFAIYLLSPLYLFTKKLDGLSFRVSHSLDFAVESQVVHLALYLYFL